MMNGVSSGGFGGGALRLEDGKLEGLLLDLRVIGSSLNLSEENRGWRELMC